MENENPNNAGQPNADISDVNPNANVDISQGYPVAEQPGGAPVEPQPGATGPPVMSGPTVEPTTPEEGAVTTPAEPEAPDAVVERLKAQNAQNAKVLKALGVDPLSDLGEQLEQGLITDEMVRNHVQAKYQPPQTTTAPEATAPASDDPVVLAEQGIEAAKKNLVSARAAYDSEAATVDGVDLSTNSKLFDAQQAVSDAKEALNEAKLDNLTHQIAADKRVKQVNESVEAVISAARENPEFANMDTSLQQAVEQTSVALTGMLADQKAREMGLNPADLNAQQYQYFAGEANKMLGNLAEFYRNLGRKEAKPGFVPAGANPAPGANVNVNANIPTPANAGGSPIPVNNPYANTNVANHEEMAKQYVKDSRAVM